MNQSRGPGYQFFIFRGLPGDCRRRIRRSHDPGEYRGVGQTGKCCRGKDPAQGCFLAAAEKLVKERTHAMRIEGRRGGCGWGRWFVRWQDLGGHSKSKRPLYAKM